MHYVLLFITLLALYNKNKNKMAQIYTQRILRLYMPKNLTFNVFLELTL